MKTVYRDVLLTLGATRRHLDHIPPFVVPWIVDGALCEVREKMPPDTPNKLVVVHLECAYQNAVENYQRGCIGGN